jgi:hypothetical protein
MRGRLLPLEQHFYGRMVHQVLAAGLVVLMTAVGTQNELGDTCTRTALFYAVRRARTFA